MLHDTTSNFSKDNLKIKRDLITALHIVCVCLTQRFAQNTDRRVVSDESKSVVVKIQILHFSIASRTMIDGEPWP